LPGAKLLDETEGRLVIGLQAESRFGGGQCLARLSQTGTRDGQHPSVEIQPCHLTCDSHLRSRKTRKQPRAAGEVKDAFAASQSSKFDKFRRPRPHHVADRVLLVQLCGIAADLISRLLTHSRFPCEA
jgi:hypothetical protein